MKTIVLHPEEKTKQSPAEAHCLVLTAQLRAMRASRDAELAGKLAALDERDLWRRRSMLLLVALLVIGAIGTGACIGPVLREATHVVR